MVEVRENGNEVQQEGQYNELVKANDPFAHILGNTLMQAGMHYISVNRVDQI